MPIQIMLIKPIASRNNSILFSSSVGWSRRAVLPLLPFMGTIALAWPSLAVESPANSLVSPSPVIAQQVIAQQVIDGLPPPPPIPDLQVPEGASVPQGSGPQQFQESESGELYMVYVNGDSPLLLEQVQQVESTATIQPYEGQQVILAGLFDQSGLANEQVTKLAQRGIDANVVSVSRVVLSPNTARAPEALAQSPPSFSPSLDDLPPADSSQIPNRSLDPPRPSVSVSPPSVSRSSSPPTVTNSPRQDNAYYVVIPGDEQDLGSMREQVLLLGARPNAVEQRDRPLGPHLLIGPFVDQDAATRWNRFFKDFGMDARVYYKR